MRIGISSKITLASLVAIGGILFFGVVAVAAIVSGSFTTGSSVNVTITQLTLGKPASSTVGDVMIASVANKGGTASTVTPPEGWTLIARTDNGGNVGMLSYWKAVGTSEPANYTWTLTPSTNAEGGIAAYSGVSTVNPVDAYASATGHSTTASAPSITTTVANDEIVTLFSAQPASVTFSTPTGMTEKYESSRAGSGPSIAADDALQVAAGVSGSKSTTLNGGAKNWTAQQIALRPSAQIKFDAAETVFGTDPSVSFTRGTDEDSYIALVFLATGSPDVTASTCSWGGNAMTQIMDSVDSINLHHYWFYLVAPASGAQTVSCSSSGNVQMAAITYSNVSSSSPVDTNFDGSANAYVANSNSSVADGTELVTSGTTHVDNSFVVIGANTTNSISSGTNATNRLSNIIFDRGIVTNPAGSVSIGLLNNSGSSELIDGFMIALQPAN